MTEAIRVTVWNEFRHERRHPRIREIYPDGIHGALARHLASQGFEVATATLDEPEHGLTDEVLRGTDVLLWWSHVANDEVGDAVVDRVCRRVLDGMGLIVLHSAMMSKVFQKLMGTSCDIKWREANETERLWVVQPAHPITRGISEYIELKGEEMYGEFFDVPPPEELIFISWFSGGEVFRSGCTYTRGRGRIFYFRPGHESYPTYHQEQVLRVISNAVQWAAPAGGPEPRFGNVGPLEKLPAP